MVEIAYVDESYDDQKFAMSALLVPVHAWREAFRYIQSYRKYLKQTYGIFTSAEVNALLADHITAAETHARATRGM